MTIPRGYELLLNVSWQPQGIPFHLPAILHRFGSLASSNLKFLLTHSLHYEKMRSNLCSGFTLLEISLVLVVIGLLVGGIFVGMSLIHEAALRSVLSEIAQLTSAVHAYQAKYNALPGDDANAVSRWGTDPNGCSYTLSNATPLQPTCNGNGDGQITPAGEAWRAIQQLSDANLIPGFYSGACVSKPGYSCVGNPYLASAGINAMRSTYAANVGYLIVTQVLAPFGNPPSGYYTPPLGTNTTTPLYWGADYGSVVIWLGFTSPTVQSTGDEYLNGDPAFAGIDAYFLDKKVDDGKPNTGAIVSNFVIWNSTCTGGVVNPAANPAYNISNWPSRAGAPICSLIIMLD